MEDGYVITNEKLKTYDIKSTSDYMCTNYINQYLSINFEKFENISKKQIADLLKKRKKIINYLKIRKINHVSGISTFYIFIKIDNFKNPIFDFSMYLLLKYNISVVPGISYGASTEKYLRISIGTEDLNKIINEIDKIKKSKKNNIDYNFLKIDKRKWA